MRPVHRGTVPSMAGQPKHYKSATDANEDLEQRLGKFCSYCERPLNKGSSEVEHVSPKVLDEDGRLNWDNFLLACKTCNTVKSRKKTSDEAFLRPDRDNTFLAFVYSMGGFVKTSNGSVLDKENAIRAQNLIDLVGLDRNPAEGWPNPSPRDDRYEKREAIWRFATLLKSKFLDTPEDVETIVIGAYELGFFSVWMAVFHDFPTVRLALIEKFNGTKEANCFDETGLPIPRPGGRI